MKPTDLEKQVYNIIQNQAMNIGPVNPDAINSTHLPCLMPNSADLFENMASLIKKHNANVFLGNSHTGPSPAIIIPLLEAEKIKLHSFIIPE